MKKKIGCCGNCVFFEQLKGYGLCHRSPPVIVQHAVEKNDEGGVDCDSVCSASQFPVVIDEDFCGEFIHNDDAEFVS